VNLRKFFLMSLALAAFAVGLELTAQFQFSHGSRSNARSVILPERERVAASFEARKYSSRGIIAGAFGLGCAFTSLTLVMVSARRHEPAGRFVTVMLLIFYVILQFAMT
jgi:hypothetical protein